jgi:hypothetical protein
MDGRLSLEIIRDYPKVRTCPRKSTQEKKWLGRGPQEEHQKEGTRTKEK